MFGRKKKEKPKKIGMVSLGCPKNQVDAELMLEKLKEAGYVICDDYDGCDVVLINTCGFIEAAKREAIDSILEVAGYKEDGYVGKLIVTGCLSERYQNQILEEMPEVDAVIGLGANADIVEVVGRVLQGERVEAFPDKEELPLEGERILSTPDYWAYLKIGEGCSNNCAFCAIPEIRGKFRSRPMENIVAEARELAQKGVKEIILIAQDTSLYGKDLYGELALPKLLQELCKVDGLHWIRFLYCYPERITDELLDVMASEPKLCHYLDIPLQHADKDVLRSMHRIGGEEEFRALIEHIREKIPDICIRTTVMTGFPGESEAQFETLAEFVRDMEFDNLGCFAFSPEEGTAAAEMDGQVDEDVKNHRQELIMQMQHDIVVRHNREKIGETMEVMVDGYNKFEDRYVGRTYRDVPEIDGNVYFTSMNPLSTGSFVKVDIFGIDEYDLRGESF
ncbi:MAG: 30S ribosomal protein S12 methylthiotransferase RimO [Clostridia bacterium]|nr:30S ribosomal protein S12 methylthiotransferase RimO [Clostridia bacterium]